MRVFLRVYPIVFFSLTLWMNPIWSQDLNPTSIEAKLLQGESFIYDFISSKPINIISEGNVGDGTSYTQEVTFNLDYQFVYESDPAFIGESKFIVERTSVNNRTLKVYTEISVKVVPSLVEAIDDVVLLSPGSNSIAIQVLQNDIAGHGASSIVGTDLVSDGYTSISGNAIVFNAVPGFSGSTSFNYTIQDGNGYQSSGVVTVIAPANPLAGSSLTYLTSSTTPVDIFVDDPSYALTPDGLLNLGSLHRKGTYVLSYVPEITSVGIESFDLINASGGVISVAIEIVDHSDPGLLVNDDIYYTSVGTPLTFDPRDNDYSQDGSILSYSPGLAFDGVNFTFVPDPGFSGVKNFYYTVVDGQKEITGNIEVFIGNYLPQKEEYTFETLENTEFVIEYKAPIKDFLWSVVTEPYDGWLSVNVGSRSSLCSQADGYHMVVYTPAQDFTGVDDFTLEYCVSNGVCKQVKINVNVLPAGGSCHCFGSDCVWAGDADNDGKVSVKDILAIGYNYGETGPLRAGQSGQWIANFADDWPFEQEESDLNNKYADSNGDGFINSADAEVLNQNISLYHSINAQEVIAQKEVPLSFVAPPGPFKAGDLISLDVYIGNEETPALDLNGVAFSVRFPSDVVDLSSIKFTPVEDWLGNGSPILTAVNVENGVLEVGMARTGNIGVFGNGKIGETRILIRDDIDGYRPGEDDLPFDIEFEKARVNNSVNKHFAIQGQSLQLNIEYEKNSELFNKQDVVIYPNPSFNQLTFHANNEDQLMNIQIFDITGGLVLNVRDINDRIVEIDHSLPQGLYTAYITTLKGHAVEKLQIIRR